MPNLRFLDNVVHHGILIKKGWVVSDTHQGIDEVANSLIDRKLAEPTDSPVTHTAALVNGSQEALPVTASANDGQAPNADADAARKAEAQAAQVAATPEAANAVNDTANKEAEVVTSHAPEGLLARARAAISGQPSAEEVAATADQA